jgi:hypothetical protein
MKIDITKAFLTTISIFIAFLGWFGKITYDKLSKIENDVQTLLIATGIDRNEIQNIKDRLNSSGPKKPVSYHYYHSEFVLPENNIQKRKKLIEKV